MSIEITKEIKEEWYKTKDLVFLGDYSALERFKEQHIEEYRLITSMYAKRVKIRACLDCYKTLGANVYWITLTFKNSKDSNCIDYKRKEAIKHIRLFTDNYLIVEEYGEDNGRYHIHGFMFTYGEIDFDLWRSWHSRQKCILLKEREYKKKTYYLTNYSVKSCPRVRRSKNCIKLCDKYNSAMRMYKCGFESELKLFVASSFPVFNDIE